MERISAIPLCLLFSLFFLGCAQPSAEPVAPPSLQPSVPPAAFPSLTVSDLAAQLESGDENVRFNAAYALANAAERGENISLAIPALTPLLAEDNVKLRRVVLAALGYAAGGGSDLSGAIGSLGAALQDPDEQVRANAAGALVLAVEESGADIHRIFPSVETALSDPNQSIRWAAIRLLADAAGNGENMAPVIPALTRTLSDEDVVMRRAAALALGFAAQNENDVSSAIPALNDALWDENPQVQGNAATALEYATRRNDIGLGEEDFPGFTPASTERKTLADLPEADRAIFRPQGFESSFSVVLQTPRASSNDSIDPGFREIHSTTWSFSNRSGAQGFFEQVVGNTSLRLEELGIGERSIFYLNLYENEQGIALEQQYVFFLQGRCVGGVSTVALQEANMTTELSLEAARRLWNKIVVVEKSIE